MVMPARFLEFDLSEDAEGLRTWDALASPAVRHTGALQDEVQRLTRQLALSLGPAGPIEEGHRWDMDLQIHDDSGQALSLEMDLPACGRIAVALSLSGGAELAALLDAFCAP